MTSKRSVFVIAALPVLRAALVAFLVSEGFTVSGSAAVELAVDATDLPGSDCVLVYDPASWESMRDVVAAAGSARIACLISDDQASKYVREGVDAVLPMTAIPADLSSVLRQALKGDLVVVPRSSGLTFHEGPELSPRPGLTAAELRLLPLLATHLSFREIGEALGVSRNTVKTQAIGLYRKLETSSRSETIDRARELGLLSSVPASLVSLHAAEAT